MAKYEMEFELTGLKFKFRGEKEDAPAAVAGVQQQLAALLQNATGVIANGTSPLPTSQHAPSQHQLPPAPVIETPAEPTKRRGRRQGGGGSRVRAEPIDFKHDATAFGLPKQEWSTGTKAVWMLYMLEQQTEHKEVSAAVLTATFNKHFKTYGAVQGPNVHRDLAQARVKNQWVNSDASTDPQTWHLLDEGKKAMAKLVEESKVRTA